MRCWSGQSGITHICLYITTAMTAANAVFNSEEDGRTPVVANAVSQVHVMWTYFDDIFWINVCMDWIRNTQMTFGVAECATRLLHSLPAAVPSSLSRLFLFQLSLSCFQSALPFVSLLLPPCSTSYPVLPVVGCCIPPFRFLTSV